MDLWTDWLCAFLVRRPRLSGNFHHLVSFCCAADIDAISFVWLRGTDLNRRPSGYEPDELIRAALPRVIGKVATMTEVITLTKG